MLINRKLLHHKGVINPATREWKDGLFSTIMRDLSNITHDGPKWIVLDGDIDPMWIESLNTVMDDNKVQKSKHCCKITTKLAYMDAMKFLQRKKWIE